MLHHLSESIEMNRFRTTQERQYQSAAPPSRIRAGNLPSLECIPFDSLVEAIPFESIWPLADLIPQHFRASIRVHCAFNSPSLAGRS